MRECEQDGEPVTKEEATEMAEMEMKANQTRHYEKSDKPRKPSSRVRKVDATKKRILDNCRVLIEGMGGVTVNIGCTTVGNDRRGNAGVANTPTGKFGAPGRTNAFKTFTIFCIVTRTANIAPKIRYTVTFFVADL